LGEARAPNLCRVHVVQAVHRFLSLVQRELGARDARIELGGSPDEGAIWAPLQDDFRVVALFDDGTVDRDEKRTKLEALVASFSGIVAGLALPHHRGDHEVAARTLADVLDHLVFRARAETAWVIDESSPEIWGSSEPAGSPLDVDDALFVARLESQLRSIGIPLEGSEPLEAALIRDKAAGKLSANDINTLVRDVEHLAAFPPGVREPRTLRALRAVASVRDPSLASEGTSSSLVRAFATIYRLVLVFDGPLSELHAEAAVIRTLPLVEQLVTSLPPRKPDGPGPETAGAKVAVLRRLRAV
jgi:hypothetical protein